MDTTARWERVEALFDAAADLDPAAREAYLDVECRTPDGEPDPALREEVEALLRLDTGAEGFFDRFGEGLTAPEPPPGPDAAGPYRLTRRLGEGGMGEVFLGERADGAFAGEVAVKVLRAGLAPDLAARVRAEATILARLDHPGIARLRDAGRLPDGRPYLVMDLAEGEPITTYADRRRLGVNERLALFESVCDAVAYAHRNLVVHRDLKPSNVVVVETPDGPRVTLLDFGIAKLLDDGPDGVTAPVTRTEQRLLTPEYAAPEQVRGEPVTTATDVYALGVLLYELLTGQRPYRLPTRAREAVERAILTEEPTMPSTAVTEAGAEIAAARATEPTRLRRRLRGDLDRIVLMALRKEPERRYTGAEALGRDLARHLAGLPVEARPESAAYRVGRFVRRHRAATAAVSALVLAAVAFGALYTVRVTAERDRAEAALARAEAATGFLGSVLESGLPAQARGDTLTVYEAIERSLETVDENLADDPLTRAAVRVAIGEVFSNTGQFARADSLLALADRDAAEARRAGTPDRALEGQIASARGSSLWAQTRYDEAEPFVRAGLAEAEESGDGVLIAGRQGDLAILLYLARPDKAEAFALLERSLATYTREVGPRDPNTLIVAGNLGQLYLREGRMEEAERTLARVLADLRAVHGADPHPEVANTTLAHAIALEDVGRRAEALRAADESHRQFLALHGVEHEQTAGAAGLLASLHLYDGRAAEAERLACPAEGVHLRVFSEVPGLAVYPGAVCAASRLGRPRDALAHARIVRVRAEAHLGETDPNRDIAVLTEGLARLASGDASAHAETEAAQARAAESGGRRTFARWAATRL